jgi:hypothetical protein
VPRPYRVPHALCLRPGLGLRRAACLAVAVVAAAWSGACSRSTAPIVTQDAAALLDAATAVDAAGSTDGGVLRDAAASSDAAASDAAAPGPLDAGPRDVGPHDPFAPLPSNAEGLTNVAADLELVLERGALEGACAAWRADPSDRRKKLLCGKWMFFSESFGTLGVPAALVDAFVENFPEVGRGMTGFGLVEDPRSPQHRPLGLSAPSTSTSAPPSVAFTCASCHFGRLPDGRWAVGQANHDFDYGGALLTLMLVPQLVRPGTDLSMHHPDAIARVRPLLDRLEADRRLRLRFLVDLLPLLTAARNGAAPALSREAQGQYASWPVGTMDFLIAPLPVDDGVHTVSKIASLFAMPTADELARSGTPHAMLGYTGVARSLEGFLAGFVVFGQGDVAGWTPERLSPLAEYIYSLRPPAPPPALAPSAADVEAGAAVFAREGCLACHDGPRGAGRRLYTYDEVGTDDAMRAWMDPDLDGQPCCGVPFQAGEVLEHRLKSPRLVGLWAMQRFLHNGTVDSLEAVLCAGGPRVGGTPPLSSAGHTFGCAIGAEDKRTLLAFLRAH